MLFQTYSYTCPGGRSNNEDSYSCAQRIWVLADGLGGHECGEVASGETTEFVVREWTARGESLDEQSIIDILLDANSHILKLQKEDAAKVSMRTTIVMAVTDGEKLRYANVGDSRIYVFRDSRIIAQSEDHSVSAAVARMGDIRYEDIRFNEDRNRLLKVIGNNNDLKIKALPPEIQLQSGDAFLLCSDGFWEYVYEQEMEIDLAKSKNPKEWLDHMVKRILLRTENMDNDNFTAVCVMVEN